MQQKTADAVNAIQRNLLTEILVSIPFLIVVYTTCFYINYHPPHSLWASFIFLFFVLRSNLYYYLRNQQSEHETPLVRLEKQLKEMSNFIRVYSILEILAVIVPVFAVLWVWHSHTKGNFWVLPAYLIIATSSAIGGFVSVRWYVGKLYGQHYNTILRAYQTLKNATPSVNQLIN